MGGIPSIPDGEGLTNVEGLVMDDGENDQAPREQQDLCQEGQTD